MYTYCPNCFSVYQVTTELIDKAAGQTRCSACQQVYRAIDYLFDDLETTRNVVNEQRGSRYDEVHESDGWEVTTDSFRPQASLSGSWDERKLSLRDIGSGVAVGLLTLLLVVQWIYFNRDEMAGTVAWRPAIERFCELLVCDLPLRVDHNQLSIVDRDVRQHPLATDALLINVAFENRADFAQPYPLFEVSFTDTTGAAIAMRRFSPAEYLGEGVDVAAGIPADAPVQVVLEVIDPGEQAVSFEFGFL